MAPRTTSSCFLTTMSSSTSGWSRRCVTVASGIGADGVLRVAHGDDGYFMDYRNADGSIAETCGNGIRVFARYLVVAGLCLLAR